jgi:hypothetical protein
MAQVGFNLPVTFISEGDQIVAYTPALDIATSGKDENEAKERFGELVRMFFADLIENNTVDAVLSELGWQKVEQQWQPPLVSQQSVNVQVPAFA